MSWFSQTMQDDHRRRANAQRPKAIVLHEAETKSATSLITDDVRLFALTFIGGFLFMTVYLA
nr:hypothetical protein [uncultured Sphingomonas sp.]